MPQKCFLFSEKSGRLILQFCCERVQRWEWEKEAKGTLLSYLMVFSNYALFRLPLAYILITSKHSGGSVQPVELSPSHTWDQVSAHPHAVAEHLW